MEFAKTAAAAYVAPKVLKNFKWQWLVYGAVAYYALKLMSKKGILPNQTGPAVDFIDNGIDKGVGFAKESLGFAKKAVNETEKVIH